MLFLNISINCYYSYNIFAVILKLFNFNLEHIATTHSYNNIKNTLNFHCALNRGVGAGAAGAATAAPLFNP